MKKLKYEILFTILFMTVGIAAVSSNLLINGSTPIASNPDDFFVYFSDVLVDGEQDLSLVQNETSLYLDLEFDELGETKTIAYSVTNASKNYDADLDVSCTYDSTYLSIINDFYTSSNLSARSTRSGILIITLSKSYTGDDLTQDISCTINASAVERTSQGSGDVGLPLSKYAIGREVSIGDEKFNIISDNGDTVTLWAQYNVGISPTKQTTSQLNYAFANSNGWEYAPGPKDIDIQSLDSAVKTLVNSYVAYLNSDFFIEAEGNLISLKQFGDLGCDVTEDYGNDAPNNSNCASSPYIDWIDNGQLIWTRSAYAEDGENIWVIGDFGDIEYIEYTFAYFGVRPTITISKEVCDDLFNDMIFFTIDGVTYKAKNGMTWSEWVDSVYNTGGFKIYNGNLYLSDIICASGVSSLSGDSVIVSLAYYEGIPQHNGGAND